MEKVESQRAEQKQSSVRVRIGLRIRICAWLKAARACKIGGDEPTELSNKGACAAQEKS